MLVNPLDWPAWERVLRAHRCGVGAQDARDAPSPRPGRSAWTAALRETARGRRRLAGLLDRLQGWRTGPPRVTTLLDTVAAEIQRHRPGARTQSADGEADRRAEDVATLLALAQRWEAETGGSLPEFLDTVVLTEEDAPTETATEMLGLTLHAAKGLEFDTVVIVGAEEGLMPHYRHTAAETLAEERRLCYVGMTRAREHLIFSVARMRRLWGDVAFRPALEVPPRGGPDRGPRDAAWSRRSRGSRSVMSASNIARRSARPSRASARRVSRPGIAAPPRTGSSTSCGCRSRSGINGPGCSGRWPTRSSRSTCRRPSGPEKRPPLARIAASAAVLLEQDERARRRAWTLIREAAALVTRWLAHWTVPVESIVAVERALAVDASGTHVEWDAPDAFIRGRLDLVTRRQGRTRPSLDWKSGWLSEDEEGLRVAWAPGLYAALLWAWAPRLEEVSVEYHYLRTGRVARVVLTRADAAETLAWARALASRIAVALATPEDPGAFPPRPSTACGTCPWVNRCPAGHAALEAMAEGPIPDDAEARRLAGLLLAGEARVGRLRERLKAYLQDREPLALDGLELGFFPTKGRYDAAAVYRAAMDAGADPWPLLAADGRTLAAFLKRRPEVEQTLAGAWTPSPAWFGHRKAKLAGGATVKFGRSSEGWGIAPEPLDCSGRDPDIPSRTGTSVKPSPPGNTA